MELFFGKCEIGGTTLKECARLELDQLRYDRWHSAMTAACLLAVAIKCVYLRALDICHTGVTTANVLLDYTNNNDAVFGLIAEHLSMLEELKLTTPRVDDEAHGCSAVIGLVRRRDKPRKLNLTYGLMDANYEDFEGWRQLRPGLGIMRLSRTVYLALYRRCTLSCG